MNRYMRIAIVVALAVVVSGVLVIKTRRQNASLATPSAGPVVNSEPAENRPLPRLVELGSVTCIPCKAMAPILEELRNEYRGALEVDFIDVNRDPDAGARFGIRIKPTQVFLDANGEELFRHEGFFPKDKILAKWKELGVDLNSPPEDETPQGPQPESKGTL